MGAWSPPIAGDRRRGKTRVYRMLNDSGKSFEHSAQRGALWR